MRVYICVGNKKKKKWMDECKRNSLSLSLLFLSFIHLYLNVNRLDYVYTSAYSSMNK